MREVLLMKKVLDQWFANLLSLRTGSLSMNPNRCRPFRSVNVFSIIENLDLLAS